MMILAKTNKRLGHVVLRAAVVMCLLSVDRDACADPPALTLDWLRESDAAELPAYTLWVTIYERVNVMLLGQGNGRYACVLTRGAPGLAVLCEAEELPKPVYFPPGSPSYWSYDYDLDGNLGVWMRAKDAAILTETTNETYDEGRSFGVSPQGVVVNTGVTRRLDRYAPADPSGGMSIRRRIWWALGHGLCRDFEHILSMSEHDGLQQIGVRSKRQARWPGVWHTEFKTQPSPIIREASWIPAARSEPTVEVVTKGARQFGSVTLAKEGVIRFPDPHNPIETRVILLDFEAHFDQELFTRVQETLKRVRADETLLIRDYRANRRRPATSRPAPPVTPHPPDK